MDEGSDVQSDGSPRSVEIYDAEQHEKMKNELKQQYPGLSMPNKVFKDEGEIELDMDELDDALGNDEPSPANERRKK